MSMAKTSKFSETMIMVPNIIWLVVLTILKNHGVRQWERTIMDYPIYYGKKDSCLKHFETTVTNQSSSENVRTSHQLRQGSALHFLISWSRDFHWDEPRGFTTCLVIGFAVWIMCYIFIVINIYNYIYIYIHSLFMVLYIYI